MANQQRVRFSARDGLRRESACGFVLDSPTIAKSITAAEGTKLHTQTVTRVRDFLAKFEKDGVEQTKRRL